MNQPSPLNSAQLPPRKPTLVTRLVKAAALVALGFTVWIALVIGGFILVPMPAARPTWTAESGKPTPDDFVFIMYPATDTVPLFDAPRGRETATLSRAVANTHRELASNGADGWVEVQTNAQPLWVRLTDLQLQPPPNTKTDYFATYADRYARLDPQGFAHASLKADTAPDGTQTVTLERRPDDDHVEKYIYQIKSGTPQPLRIYMYFGPGQALASFPLLAGVCIAATLAAAATIFIGPIIFARLFRRTQLPPEPDA